MHVHLRWYSFLFIKNKNKIFMTRGRGKVGGGAFLWGSVLGCDGSRYMKGKV